MTEYYAESVAIVGMSIDGHHVVSGRLGRFPVRGLASLWLSITAAGRQYAVAEEMALNGFEGRTDTAASDVEFMQAGRELAWFRRRGSVVERFAGSVAMRASAHRDLDPPIGAGVFRVGFQAEFVASHVPVKTRSGRIEVFGSLSVAVDLPEGVVEFDGMGKWHEQVGDRPSFSGAFTYLSAQTSSHAILARSGRGGSWGFVLFDGRPVAVRRFEIDPPGGARHFQLELEDGRKIIGIATVRWCESVPIEGRRRLGSFVDVECSLGHLIGQLNDWDPDDGTLKKEQLSGRLEDEEDEHDVHS